MAKASEPAVREEVKAPTGEPLWWCVQAVLLARSKWCGARAQRMLRIDRMRAWMEQRPTKRTIGEAQAHVGMGAADEDVRLARLAMEEALSALAVHGPALLAALWSPA